MKMSDLHGFRAGVDVSDTLSRAATGAKSDICPVDEMRLIFDDFGSKDGALSAHDAEGRKRFEARFDLLAAAIPCFTPESRVATDRGEVPIAALRPGMKLVTRDNGLQELLWIGQEHFDWRALGLNPLLRPGQIAGGALGRDGPERDMIVSPNHRFLNRVAGLGESGEQLVMARDFVGQDGVSVLSLQQVSYVQLLCEGHELLMVDSCWSESFEAGPATLSMLSAQSRQEIAALMPGLETAVSTQAELRVSGLPAL